MYYSDKDRRVLVKLNEETIKNIELISNDSRTDIHSYTKSGAGTAILGGLIAGDEGFATGALLGRETKIYSSHEYIYTILITLKNNKSLLVECDDKEKNELFFLKNKLTSEEIEVEEAKNFSELERDYFKIMNTAFRINIAIEYALKVNKKPTSEWTRLDLQTIVAFLIRYFVFFLFAPCVPM